MPTKSLFNVSFTIDFHGFLSRILTITELIFSQVTNWMQTQNRHLLTHTHAHKFTKNLNEYANDVCAWRRLSLSLCLFSLAAQMHAHAHLKRSVFVHMIKRTLFPLSLSDLLLLLLLFLSIMIVMITLHNSFKFCVFISSHFHHHGVDNEDDE